MPGRRDIFEFPEEPSGGWFSFLSMAGAEFRGPVTVAILAALAVFLLIMLRAVDVVPSWLIVAPVLAFLGTTLWSWIASDRRLQALEDYPLAKIASAPQGYVSLEGRAALFPGNPLDSPLTHRPCCWYSYEVVELDDARRNRSADEHEANEMSFMMNVGSGERVVDPKGARFISVHLGNRSAAENETTEWSFMMSDGSGECVVSPKGARLVSVRVTKWRVGNFRYTERLILPGDPLLVLGAFETSGSMVTEHDVEFQVGQLIAEWKKDMPVLIKRFDLDGGGRISDQKWERVRTQARRDVEAELARNPPQPQNRISNPGGERPFIISAKSRRQLEKDMTIWVWIHLCCFLLGVTILAAWAFRK